MRHALFPAGKRIRPLLCITAYRAAGGKSLAEVMNFACGIELLHTFSLIQDDLPCMDDDDERRGRPSLHRRFGEAAALLTSDAMFSEAFELFAGAPVTCSRRVRAIKTIARAVGRDGIVEGQLNDIDPGKSHDARTLRRIHQLKTARLIAASLVTGAIVAGARRTVTAGLDRAGTYLGMLFQITDDLLDDCSGAEADSGTDLPGSLNYLQFYGRERTQFRAERYLARYELELGRLKNRLSAGGLRELKGIGVAVLRRRK